MPSLSHPLTSSPPLSPLAATLAATLGQSPHPHSHSSSHPHSHSRYLVSADEFSFIKKASDIYYDYLLHESQAGLWIEIQILFNYLIDPGSLQQGPILEKLGPQMKSPLIFNTLSNRSILAALTLEKLRFVAYCMLDTRLYTIIADMEM